MKRINRFLIQTTIVFSLLFSPFNTSVVTAAPDDIIVSGITTPAEANGTYTLTGTHSGFNYWSFVSGAHTYYIYNDVYGTGTSRYWNIDIDDRNDEGTKAVLFYSASPSTAASPVTLTFTGDAGIGSPIVATGTPTPNIVVNGNNYPINNGSSTISSGNFTNIGTASTSGGTVSVSRTFIINNNGSAALTLSGSSPYITISGANASNFSVTQIPAQSIPASTGSTTFAITFTPSFEGFHNAVVTINSNDPDEGTFTFGIQGYGFVAKSIVLSGLTEPSAANGTYSHMGVIHNFQYWKHQTLNYYIHYDIYSGTGYWNIDNDTDGASSYFYVNSESGTPVGLTGWTALTALDPDPTGTPVINYAVLSPEINVKGNSTTIVANDSTPSFLDQTKFGSVEISTGSRTRTYTIENTGTAALTISGVTLGGADASEFSKTNPVLSSIPAGSSTTFAVTFDPSTEGTKTATVSIGNNDSDENPYTFSISGDGYIPRNLIVSGITTPSAANGTYIYQGIQNEFQYWKHETQGYYIFNDEYNSGYYWNIDVDLLDTNLNFLFYKSSVDVAPVGLTSWAFNATAGYESSGEPTIVYSGAEMDVKGNGNSISDGSSTPATTNHTDFGAVSVASGTASRTYTISNTGTVDLALNGTPKVIISGTDAGDFAVTTQPASPVTALTGTTMFTVEFNPSGAGTRSAVISIANDDSDENPYNFSIQGTGLSAPTVTSAAAASITGTGATLGGNVTSDGGAAVTERGVVYSSINTVPVIGGANVTQDTNGTGTGAFSEAISGLTAATHYYFQAYAINSEGTTYGGVQEFTTLNAITLITRAGSNPTNASLVSWNVGFGSALTGLTSANFSLVTTGVTGPTITGVTGIGTTWTVTVDTGTGSGTLGLNLVDDTGLSTPLSNEPFTGEVFTIDRVAPTTTLIQAAGQADPAGSAPVNFTVTFNEDVTGFATGDVDLSASTASGTLTGTVTGGPAVYNVAVSGITGDGVVTASVPAGIAQDAAGNTSAASTSTDNSVTYDSVSPGVIINQAIGQADPTNAGPIYFRVVFTEPVTGFATGDVTLTSALAGLTQTVAESAPMNGTTFDVSVGGLSGGGTVSASIAAGAATDAALHGNTASTSTDNTVTFDDAGPETTIDSNPAASTTDTSANFTFSATDSGTGVASFGCNLDAAGFTACASPKNFTGLSGGSHTFLVRATDNIGNVDSTPASFTWMVDASAPMVDTFTVTSPSTSRNIPVTAFTATDDIGVTGYLVTTTSTVPATGDGGWTGTAPTTYTVATDGTYTLYPWAKDAAGRISLVFSTPRSVTVDATAPSVTINQATGQADPVKTGPVTFTAVFSETVTGFDVTDVDLTACTAPGVAVGTVTGGPTIYTITVNATGDGLIIVSIPAGAANDAFSNASTASTSTDNSVTLDTTNPTVAIDSITPNPTNAGTTVTWHSDENGSYLVRVGGTDCATGTQITSSTYSTSPATINTVIPSANLAAGNNTVRVCVTDSVSNSGSTIDTVTKVLTPIVTTIAASPLGNSTATLRGTVNANGSSTTIQFEYGLTVAYGTTVTAMPATATGSANMNVSTAITGLTPNTTYHYRVSGTNANGTTNGADMTFTTTDLGITLIFHDPLDAPVTSAVPGTILHVAASVTHSDPTDPTGSLVFTRYNNVTCTGTGTAAGSLPIGVTVDPSQSSPLTNNGLSFKARYAGDSHYPAVESACVRISDSEYPSVLSLSTSTIPRNGVIMRGGPSKLVVQFNTDVFHTNTTDVMSVLNPANFLLASRTTNDLFNTGSCAGGIVPDDSGITVDSVSYDPATFTATLSVNGGTRLPPAYYKLYICGTTSIADVTGTTYLNNHTDDSLIGFRVVSGTGSSSGRSDPDALENVSTLPATGFTPNVVTSLPDQPLTNDYSDMGDLMIEIPSLGVKTSVIGVPILSTGWDLTWLNKQVGWLEGTAFPTWNGNTVLTAHAYTSDGLPGPFALLKDLKYDDTFSVHFNSEKYTYAIRSNTMVYADDTELLTRHEELDWVTLITCHQYDEKSKSYLYRWIVRAVLVDVQNE